MSPKGPSLLLLSGSPGMSKCMPSRKLTCGAEAATVGATMLLNCNGNCNNGARVDVSQPSLTGLLVLALRVWNVGSIGLGTGVLVAVYNLIGPPVSVGVFVAGCAPIAGDVFVASLSKLLSLDMWSVWLRSAADSGVLGEWKNRNEALGTDETWFGPWRESSSICVVCCEGARETSVLRDGSTCVCVCVCVGDLCGVL
jgi:hypothetical protein